MIINQHININIRPTLFRAMTKNILLHTIFIKLIQQYKFNQFIPKYLIAFLRKLLLKIYKLKLNNNSFIILSFSLNNQADNKYIHKKSYFVDAAN